MRVLNIQYIVDVGTTSQDNAIIEALISQCKIQKKQSPSGIQVLIGEEIKNA